EHFLAIFLAAAGLDRVAQHVLFTVVVHPRIEAVAAALTRLRDGPARKAARHFDDVLLRVAAVHAERVQLHQLAAVVFVQAGRPLVLRVLLWLRPLRHRWKTRPPDAEQPSATSPPHVVGHRRVWAVG